LGPLVLPVLREGQALAPAMLELKPELDPAWGRAWQAPARRQPPKR
jgi:hypothetical protein